MNLDVDSGNFADTQGARHGDTPFHGNGRRINLAGAERMLPPTTKSVQGGLGEVSVHEVAPFFPHLSSDRVDCGFPPPLALLMRGSRCLRVPCQSLPAAISSPHPG